jgi:hypothetical protein
MNGKDAYQHDLISTALSYYWEKKRSWKKRSWEEENWKMKMVCKIRK